MEYNSLKIIHIISAAFLFTSMVYCCYSWLTLRRADPAHITKKVQAHTSFIIIPFAVLQLISGFFMLSQKKEELAHLWVTGSLLGFMVTISSWIAFVYFLLTSTPTSRRLQTVSLCTSAIAFLIMIFFMSNKIV